MRINILSNSNFRYLWGSQILSQLTVNIMTFLVLLRIFELTGSTMAASFVWVASALPAMIVGPLGAVASDLFDRRKILMITNFAQAVIIFLFALTYQRIFYLSYGVVLGYSLFNQFYTPAESSSLPILVKKQNLPQANGIFFISQQVAVLSAFAFAGLAGEVFGFGTAALLGSFFLILAFFSVSRLPSIKVETEGEVYSFEEMMVQFFIKIIDGYQFIRRKKDVFYPFAFLIFLQASLTILFVNLPEIGIEVIGTKPSLVGLMAIVPAGVGALIGTFLTSKLLSRKWRKKRLIKISLIVLGAGLILMPVVVPLLGYWSGKIVAIICFFAAGMSYVSALVPSLTFLQERTPAEYTGRVFGNFWFITSIITVLPVLFGATITEIFGVQVLMVVMGGITLSMLGLLHYYMPIIFKYGV